MSAGCSSRPPRGRRTRRRAPGVRGSSLAGMDAPGAFRQPADDPSDWRASGTLQNGSSNQESSMRLADGIRKHGFQKWYSRELTRSHLGLLLLLLCTLALFSILELLTRRAPMLQQLGNVGLLAVCVGI